jgi:hypothetical protein
MAFLSTRDRRFRSTSYLGAIRRGGSTRDRIAALLWTCAAVLLWIGCTNPQAEDRPTIARAFDADRQVLAIIQEADGLAKGGKREAAAEVLEGRGAVAVQRAQGDATALAPKSDWGKARRADLLGLAKDRDRDLKSYAAALRHGDEEAMLGALTQEIETDKKAEALEQALK